MNFVKPFDHPDTDLITEIEIESLSKVFRNEFLDKAFVINIAFVSY